MHSDMKEEIKKESSSSLPVEDINLQRAVELINSLISSSYSIRSFSGKWQLVREKLEQLLSGLTTASNSNLSCESPELSSLLKTVTSTLKDINQLLYCCGDESCDGGKLLIRSNLDSAASKLELHIKNLAEIYASGILTPSEAIILSKPGVGASREEMRFYLKDTFLRLKIGETSVKTRALADLHEILHEDENYVKIVGLEIAEGVNLLVSFLEFEDTGIQDGAAAAVLAIAEYHTYKGALATAGAIAPLIQILEKGTEFGKEKAARALVKLTEKSDNAWSVSAHGGVTLLLKICSNVDGSKDLVAFSCKILTNLSGVQEIKRFMIEEGAISVLLQLSRSKEEVIRVQAIDFMLALASEDYSIRKEVNKEELIRSLVQLLDPSSSYSTRAREVAFRATEFFCFDDENSLHVLMSYNFLDRILFFLKCGEISIQELALKTVSHLCEISEEYRKAMGDIGFVPELVRLLEAKSFQVKEIAAATLYSMILVKRNCRRFIQDDHNVNLVMRLLAPDEEKSVTKKLLLSVLLSISECHSGRRKIINSEYMHNLEKLADSDVQDAKKVLKKLLSSRFRDVLNGIWSY